MYLWATSDMKKQVPLEIEQSHFTKITTEYIESDFESGSGNPTVES